SKGSSEFTLSDVGKITGEVYSPPFATSDDMFWQLKFVPSFKDDPDYFSLFLCAIPNAEEEHMAGVWSRRGTLSATLYLRTQSGQEYTGQYVKTFIIGMDNFCAKWGGYGLNRFYKKSLLPNAFTLGVEFDSAMFRPLAQAGPLPGKPIPEALLEAWTEHLNKSDTADVEFNVQGTKIYASSVILVKRSDYFSRIFQQKWAELQTTDSTSTTVADESTTANVKTTDKLPTADDVETTISSSPDAESAFESSKPNNIKYVIDVTDFHHVTFLEMLKFLYTDKVNFDRREDSHKNSLDLFSIADKYLVTDLRQRAKAKLCRDLNDNNAAELLFSAAWKWPDLKDVVMTYVVENFSRVRRSSGFKNIQRNSDAYPRSSEVLMELLGLLIPDDETKQ
ncbi:2105_t:CDS:2, partial [Paraglomus occultum]